MAAPQRSHITAISTSIKGGYATVSIRDPGRDFVVDAWVTDAPSSSAPACSAAMLRWCRRAGGCGGGGWCGAAGRGGGPSCACLRLWCGRGSIWARLSVRSIAPLLRRGAALPLCKRAGLLCGHRALQRPIRPPFPDALCWLRVQRASALGMPLSCNTWTPGRRPRAWMAGFFSASGMW
jgi:hypothetical protein